MTVDPNTTTASTPGGLTGAITALGNTAGTILTGLGQTAAERAKAAAAQKSASAQQTNANTFSRLTPWLIVGGILLVVAFIFLRRRN